MNELTTERGFRLHNRGELVEVIPYLVGYRPVDSLVVVALATDGTTVCLTTRVDLVDAAEPAVAKDLVAMADRARADQLVLIVYGPKRGTSPELEDAEVGLLPYDDLVYDLVLVARKVGIGFLGAVYVADERWWTYQPCLDERCCRPEGTPMETVGSRVAAEATYAGMTALPDRESVAAALEPIQGPNQVTMSAAVATAERELVEAGESRSVRRWRAGVLTQLRGALERASKGEVPWIADDTAARILVGLADRVLRDHAWMWFESDPGGRWAAAEQLWRQMARRAPEEYRGAPLFLYAWACWRGGDGVRARIAVERSLSYDSNYPAALLLEEALHRGMDPRKVRPLLPRSGRHARSADAPLSRPGRRGRSGRA